MKENFLSSPKSIAQCFQTSSLKLIVQKSHKILAVEKFLNQIMPPEIPPHCQIMNLTQRTLILQLESSAWATRVRYLVPHLLKQFAQQNLGIQRIKCRVRPDL
ncbi:MAG: DciA family protein [Coxiella endosymbiont of Haemaphysalis qinghaiensis]